MLTEDAKKGRKWGDPPSFTGVVSADDPKEPDAIADIGDLTYDELLKAARKKFGTDYLMEIRRRFPDRKSGRARKQELIDLLS